MGVFNTAPEAKNWDQKFEAQYIFFVDQNITLIIGFSKLRGNFMSRTVNLGFPYMTSSYFESSSKVQPV
jgi:hypothetical protein